METRRGSGEVEWASLERDRVGIMVAIPNLHEPFLGPVFSGSLYINTDDVTAVWEQVKANALVCYPLEDFAYGMREFAIYDNNGYLLQFGQPIEIPRKCTRQTGNFPWHVCSCHPRPIPENPGMQRIARRVTAFLTLGFCAPCRASVRAIRHTPRKPPHFFRSTWAEARARYLSWVDRRRR